MWWFPVASTVVGCVLLLLVVYDAYATILHARAWPGPVAQTINRTTWTIARSAAFRLSRAGRHRMLNAVGPLLLPALIASYILLLMAGFALVYLPHMPESFVLTSRSRFPPWFDAVYFSGSTMTTLGYGDVVPDSAAMRVVALLEVTTGFAVITLSITYLLSVYGALLQKRAVALTFYHQAEEGADVAGFVAHYFVEDEFRGLSAAMSTASRDLQQLHEAHVEHPIIHYFHPMEVHKGLPRVLFIVLETCTVVHACLDDDAYPAKSFMPEMRTLELTARYALKRLVTALPIDQSSQPGRALRIDERARWERRYDETVARLREAGIKTQADRARGFEEYVAQRGEWEATLYRFARYLGYDWDEVTGDHGLGQAASDGECGV